MAELGQAEYCLDIHSFKSDDLLRRFFALQAHSKVIQSAVASTCREYDEVLKRQCRDITRLSHSDGAEVLFPKKWRHLLIRKGSA